MPGPQDKAIIKNITAIALVEEAVGLIKLAGMIEHGVLEVEDAYEVIQEAIKSLGKICPPNQ